MNDMSGDFLEYMDEAYSKANFYSCSISAKYLQKFEITTTVVNSLHFRSGLLDAFLPKIFKV